MTPTPSHRASSSPDPPARGTGSARGLRGAAVRPVALLLAVLAGTGVAAAADLPSGWHKEGTTRQYRAGVDPGLGREGGASAYLKSWTAEPPTYGTLMQQVDAERYRGKRVRLTGWLRTEDVDHDDGWAGLWLRIDGVGGHLGYDNTDEERVRETTGWTRLAVVLDVDERAQAVSFGFMLVGSGKVWADDLEFEEVGRDVPVTAVPERKLPKTPVNLGFEDLTS